jgi:hypothetical protein
VLDDACLSDPLFNSWLVDLDIAATLRKKGWRTDQSTSLLIRGELEGPSGGTPFEESRLIERFFWKHLPPLIRIPLHAGGWFAEAAWSIVHGQFLPRTAGRLVGLLQAPFDALHRWSSLSKRSRAACRDIGSPTLTEAANIRSAA